jgi:hypothetical protein
LRNEVLYWYKNHQSNEAKNKIILSEAESCFGHKTKVKNFKIKVGGKFYKFAAENQEERDEWVEAMRKIIYRDHEKEAVENEQNETLFIAQRDKNPLFFDHEAYERRQKALETVKQKEDKEEARMEEMQKSLDSRDKKLNPLVINTGNK